MSQYNIIVATAEATVVSEYEPQQTRSDAYQSEAALEAAFIKQLTEQGYTYLQIHSSDELVKNLRQQLEKLNGYHFSDDEWRRFFSQNLANSNDGIVEKTRLIQEDNVQVLKRDDGSSKNITLIDKKNIHNNSLQVINQYVENSGNYDNRYDVTILVNGFPLVHIELKRRGVALKEAFNQIERYQRDMKNREVDLLIVVNMFLTGFDATTLNTLWVDKNLRQHGLIQAFSRTNRILNSVKTFGNIVCFRNLQKETDDAIALFGDKNASGIVLMKSYNDYYYGYDDENGKHQKGYEERIAELIQKYPLGTEILGERAKKDFIVSFGNILRLRNILSTFDDFAGNEVLSAIDMQDYTGIYNDLYLEFRPQTQKENIDDDIVFEMELVKQIEVNIDYILMLVAKYHKSNCEDKEILIAIDRAIKSSIELRSKKELIENFIATINTQTDVNSDWKKFVLKQKETDLSALIADEKLKDEETRKYMENAFRDGAVKTTGTDIDKLMPPVSRFGGGNRAAKKQGIIEKIQAFFEKYFGIV